jgi:hypothetical protein
LLDGDLTERIAVKVSDDLTVLTGHWFKVQGYVV